MHSFGEGLGQPVGQRLGHDRPVVIVVLLEFGDQPVYPDPGGDGKRADVIRSSGLVRRDEVGEGERWALRSGLLLAERVETGQLLDARLIAEDHDVVSVGVGRKEPVHGAGR